jgi:hypothetical protein
VIDPFPIAVTKKLPDMESDLVIPFCVCVIRRLGFPVAIAWRSVLLGWLGPTLVMAGNTLRTSILRRTPFAQAIFASAPT